MRYMNECITTVGKWGTIPLVSLWEVVWNMLR